MTDFFHNSILSLIPLNSAEMSQVSSYFFSELLVINTHLPATFLSLFYEFIGSYALIAIPVVIIMIAVSASALYILSHFTLQRTVKGILLVFTELLALALNILPYSIPFKSLRLFCGFISFVLFMCIHSQIINTTKSDGSFVELLFNTFLWNSKRIETKKVFSTLPSVSIVFRCVLLLISIDSCTYLTREWIPINIQNTNQYLATGIITGFWIFFAIEFFYTQFIMIFDLLGYPIPMEIRHNNPLMSCSASKFWGVRWNPIVCKLLQISFYKPLRRIGVPKSLCVISCFAGSGMLHVIPVYTSIMSVKEASMMGMFFAGQGIIVLVEQVVFAVIDRFFESKEEITNPNPYHIASNRHSRLSSNNKDKNISRMNRTETSWVGCIPYIGEYSLMMVIAGLFYCISEKIKVFNLILSLTLPFIIATFCLLVTQIDGFKEKVDDDLSETVLLPNENIIDKTIEKESEKNLSPNPNSNSNSNSKPNPNPIPNLSKSSQKEPTEVTNTFLIKTEKKLMNKRIKEIKTASYLVFGWIWTISTLIITLPLFTMPVYHICDTVSPHSQVIGPFIRTIQYAGWI
jgi:hypothetical protein